MSEIGTGRLSLAKNVFQAPVVRQDQDTRGATECAERQLRPRRADSSSSPSCFRFFDPETNQSPVHGSAMLRMTHTNRPQDDPMIAKSTQTGFSVVSEKPACFPSGSRRGSRSPVSIGEKMRLFQYGCYQRLTIKELALEAGVSTSCINDWRRDIEKNRCRTANKVDNRLLDLVAPDPFPLAIAGPAPFAVLPAPLVDQDIADFDEAFFKVYRKTDSRPHQVEDNVVAIRPVNAAQGVRGFVRKMTDEGKRLA